MKTVAFAVPGAQMSPARLPVGTNSLHIFEVFSNIVVVISGGTNLLSCSPSALQESFFKRLTGMLEAIPSAVLTQKILPLLSHALEYGGETIALLCSPKRSCPCSLTPLNTEVRLEW